MGGTEKTEGYSKVCVVCGKAFISKLPKTRYCSRQCATANVTKWYTCQQCGKQFKSKHSESAHVFCSRECAFEAYRYNPAYAHNFQCEQCGATYLRLSSDAKDNSRFCSGHCEQEHKEQSRRCICKVCGKEFIGSNSRCVYCSDKCKKDEANRKSKEYSVLKHKQKYIAPIVCQGCGKEFIPEYGDKKRSYCSDECKEIALKPFKKASKRIRRQRIKNTRDSEYFGLKYIFKRDKGKCQICGKKLNLKDKVPNPNAPTMDHVIPLSKGGAHTKRNVQLACFQCNYEKSNKMPQVQLALVG